jgi:hypothetical protein
MAKGPTPPKSARTGQSPTALTIGNAYRQTNLVSDIPGAGQILDASLVNLWGITESATSPFWVSNGTGTVDTLRWRRRYSAPHEEHIDCDNTGRRQHGSRFNATSNL